MENPKHIPEPHDTMNMEPPIATPVIQNTEEGTSIDDAIMVCAHQRLIDDVRTKDGKPTDKVRCLECLAVFDDPYYGRK